MSDKRPSNARPYGADARLPRRGRRPRRPAVPRPCSRAIRESPLRCKPTSLRVTRRKFQSVAAGDTTIIHYSFFISSFLHSPLFPLPFFTFSRYNDDMMAKSRKAFRRAALPRSKTALLFCHIILVMSIGRMIQRIIRCQTCRLAAKSIEFSIDFALR